MPEKRLGFKPCLLSPEGSFLGIFESCGEGDRAIISMTVLKSHDLDAFCGGIAFYESRIF